MHETADIGTIINGQGKLFFFYTIKNYDNAWQTTGFDSEEICELCISSCSNKNRETIYHMVKK